MVYQFNATDCGCGLPKIPFINSFRIEPKGRLLLGFVSLSFAGIAVLFQYALYILSSLGFIAKRAFLNFAFKPLPTK
jgi:hypothetical protein